MNGLGEDIGSTVFSGKVIRPLRSVDPSQTEYQGLIEVTEEGEEPSFKIPPSLKSYSKDSHKHQNLGGNVLDSCHSGLLNFSQYLHVTHLEYILWPPSWPKNHHHDSFLLMGLYVICFYPARLQQRSKLPVWNC